MPRNWGSLRREVLTRDDRLCQVGGPHCDYVAVEVDHIVPRKDGGGHELENLRSICKPCHSARQEGKSGPKRLPLTRGWFDG